MILKPQQRKVFEKGLATVSATLQKLQFLQGLAEASPELAERLKPILSQHEFLTALATLALELDSAVTDDGE